MDKEREELIDRQTTGWRKGRRNGQTDRQHTDKYTCEGVARSLMYEADFYVNKLSPTKYFFYHSTHAYRKHDITP